MTKHEADVIGGLNMTDQISDEAYKQIMIAAQDENEVGEVLAIIRVEIESKYESIPKTFHHYETGFTDALEWVLSIIDKYKAESEEEE